MLSTSDGNRGLFGLLPDIHWWWWWWWNKSWGSKSNGPYLTLPSGWTRYAPVQRWGRNSSAQCAAPNVTEVKRAQSHFFLESVFAYLGSVRVRIRDRSVVRVCASAHYMRNCTKLFSKGLRYSRYAKTLSGEKYDCAVKCSNESRGLLLAVLRYSFISHIKHNKWKE